MLDGINRALNTDCGVDTAKVLELVAQYRNALDQEENAFDKVKEARDKCQAIKKAEQAVRDAKQKYQDVLQELHKQQEKFDDDNTELFCKVSETHHASKDAETRLLNEIRR
ncbi:conserved domain protein [Gardnerella vaginalis 315-A]|uniref:hypothetical protein n=1 Tax=Gardnerella vaginalis TaxID=2702 RepID=UPI00020D718B|nr:hypothetical protein [Gardnerella vaginalis]EGL14156.1 conserved domain protein [Gardnerella vaginalis 315-A]